jgi:hypothetical protein
MSADIEKLAVFDSRIVQSRPKYAVQKGALSLTNAPFRSIAATTSQHTYNIYVPSENVYVDRALRWSSSVFMSMSVAVNPGVALLAGDALVQAGRDFALRSFPLNALCSTMTATINDTTSVINTQDVLDQVLRLTDYKKNRLQRTCPTMLDKYLSYNDAFGSVNNPIGGYDSGADYDNVQNGSYPDVVFTDNNGNPLGTATPAYAGAAYNAVNGVPVYDGATAGPYTIYFRFRSTEELVLSPFVYADCHEWDTGLFGINNIQLIMNLVSSPSRIVRATTKGGRTISAIGYNNVPAGAFQNSVINVQFLTPSLDVPLPPKSVVPYFEFPRYISNQSITLAPGQVGQLQSQTITLPQIPDMFIIYCKPSQAYAATEGDYLLPVATTIDGVSNPLSVNFDNFSGLLSSHTAEELYSMSVKNGLDMDYATWAGLAHSGVANYGGSAATGSRIPLVGGPLVLRPSQDITLQTGQAPSLVGNFTFQFNIQVKNNSPYTQTPQLYVITANSGFFESIRGSSRIIKGVLSEQDIIGAPIAPMGTHDSLARVVGGAGLFSNLGNILSKAKDIYEKTKPIGTAIKGMLPEGHMAQKAMGLAGYGMTGGEGTGAGMAGAGKKGKLAARLL